MTDRELDDFIKHGETGFVSFAMVFGEGWATHAIEIAKELRARLAQPEPEPVTMVISKTGDSSVTMSWWHEPALPVGTSLYTAPPQREWQGLTDEEVKAAWSQLWYDLGNGKFAASDDPARHTTIMFAKEIEAKLKEKNT